ncbi:MAG: OmpA family protein [Bacteroidia bacterium]
MNKIKNLLLCLISLTILTVNTDAAPKAKKSKTAKADALYNRELYSQAMELYKKSYVKQKKAVDKGRTAWFVAECYRKTNNSKESAGWYEKAYASGNKEPQVILNWADALKMNGKYDEASAKYNEYKTLNTGDNKGDAGIQACTMAQEWKDKPTRFTVENASALNTRYFDFATAQSPTDKNSLYFTSSREESNGTTTDGWYGQKFFDLFQSTADNNGKWSTPTAVAAPVNSAASDGSAAWDSKGTTMYFTRCQKIPGKTGFCKIYKVSYSGSGWGTPDSLPFNSDDYSTGHPSLSTDGNSLYFSSDMPGGQGGHDIYVSNYDAATSTWGAPMNLGTAVNTSGEEMFPYINDNGKLYFSSNGLPGMGGLDIFSASSDAGTWNVNNLKSPMNSSGDDFGIMFTAATTGFISSNREGGLGADDIYSFVMPPPNFAVFGRVYDTDTKENIAGATVELFGSDGTSLSVKTEGPGTYRYQLKPGVKYKLSASFTGYLTKFADVSTVGIDESKDFEENFDFPLKSTARPITLPEIFYDLDKSTLRPESKKALDGLVSTLNENPTITVKLTSHTDLRASDAYNVALSGRRAKSVVDYLIKSGIDKERLSWEGKGETSPKEVENNEEYTPFKTGDKLTPEFIGALSTNDLKEKAHQYNRRTEFEVLSTDYVPKQ